MSGVVSAADSFLTFASKESLRLLLGALIPGILKGGLYVIKWFFSLQPSDRDANAKLKAETLMKIWEVRREKLTGTSGNLIKALYENIRMYYPIKVNDYILMFAREKCISYENRELKAFTVITPLPDVLNESEQTYNTRYRKIRKVYLISFLITVAVFFIPMYFVLEAGKAAHGEFKIIAVCTFVTLYVTWGILAWFILNDFERQRMARNFYKKFAPWLNNKINEENTLLTEQQLHAEYERNLSDNQSDSKAISTSLMLWLRNKWKT